MIIRLYEENPSPKVVEQVAAILKSGGVVAYPTDGVYAFGAMLGSAKGLEKITAIKGKKYTTLSILCSDISQVANYAKVDNAAFKLLKRNLPGSFTFILTATSKTPTKVLPRRDSIGVRIPANNIALSIVEALGVPMVTTSIKDPEMEYMVDPSLIEERYTALDAVVDGGYGSFKPTTVVDLSESSSEPVVLRQSEAELMM